MSKIWNAAEYDLSRRRLIPCYDRFYASAAELVAGSIKTDSPSVLDLGAGTGLLSEFVLGRIGSASLSLLDESPNMLAKAEARLAHYKPMVFIQSLNDPLPSGKFDAIISALAVHHLSDAEKRNLFARIFHSLAPGGVFVNAEQVLGPSIWHEHLYEEMHLNTARTFGSSEQEIAEAIERMSFDRCATLSDQISWLRAIGFERVNTFFQWFRFAVYAGWKSE